MKPKHKTVSALLLICSIVVLSVYITNTTKHSTSTAHSQSYSTTQGWQIVVPRYDKQARTITIAGVTIAGVVEYYEAPQVAFGSALGLYYKLKTEDKNCPNISGQYYYMDKNTTKTKTDIHLSFPVLDETKHPKEIQKIDNLYFIDFTKVKPYKYMPLGSPVGLFSFVDAQAYSQIVMSRECMDMFHDRLTTDR